MFGGRGTGKGPRPRLSCGQKRVWGSILLPVAFNVFFVFNFLFYWILACVLIFSSFVDFS